MEYYVDNNSNGWKIIGHLVKEGKYPTAAYHDGKKAAVTIPTEYTLKQRNKLIKSLGA